MLNPKSDRLDYGKILSPPSGYSLDFAVGTTYSLDLDAFVGASLALGLSEETDSDFMNNPVLLLESLRSIGDKVALFCEGGQIHLPNRFINDKLYILLEKMVFSVKTAERSGSYPSFHPKFWLIRYKNKAKEYIYRVIILSRNLTFDRSWDTAFYMDGNVSSDITTKNNPVCDFLNYLLKQLKQLPDNGNVGLKKEGIKSLIKELPKVDFKPADKEFYDFDFIPLGIRGHKIEDTDLLKDTFHEIVIMSPFVSSNIIGLFNNRNTRIKDARYMLITREMSLSKLKPDDVSNFDIYTMRDKVIDGESAISDDSDSIQKQDIHAKVYMMRKDSLSDLYLGSVNASHNGFNRNGEFMIRLRSTRRYLSLEKLRDSLFCGKENNPDNPFQKVELSEETDLSDNNKLNDMNEVIKSLNRSNPNAKVDKNDSDDKYTVSILFKKCDTKGFNVSIRPLLSYKTVDFAENIQFSGLTLLELSQFYVARVSDGDTSVERVLIIQTKGLPEGRDKAVVSSVIKDEDSFYRYINFVLADDYILSSIESSEIARNSGNTSNNQSYNTPALYEKMLQTAATSPEKFKGIEYLMNNLTTNEVIPEDFKKLYKTFKKVVKLDV